MVGRIEVECEPGQGSCFEVIMNLKVAENRSVSLEPQAEKEELDKNILKGMRFLCAEDNELNAEILIELSQFSQILLNKAGFLWFYKFYYVVPSLSISLR